jgi:uncharacterized protein DUF6265
MEIRPTGAVDLVGARFRPEAVSAWLRVGGRELLDRACAVGDLPVPSGNFEVPVSGDIHMRAFLPALLVALSAGTGALALQSSKAQRPTLKDLEFMAGCWRGASEGGAVIDEYYTPPSDNMMLGLSRYTKGGRVTSYEFSTISAQGDSDLVLTPRPEGETPADFHLTKLQPGMAVWSNPKHDFPQVISYRRLGKDSLAARIEGPGAGGTQSSEWKMGRVPCAN